MTHRGWYAIKQKNLNLKVEIAPYLCPCRCHCLLLLAPGYALKIQVGQEYLWEAKSSVIVCVFYSFCFLLFSLKPFSFIRSSDIQSTKSRQINKYGANVSPCKTSVKCQRSLSQSDEQNIAFMFL